VTVDSDLKTTAVGLAPLFVELCASVPSCEADFMDLLADRQVVGKAIIRPDL
jgi:hypothetical protein